MQTKLKRKASLKLLNRQHRENNMDEGWTADWFSWPGKCRRSFKRSNGALCKGEQEAGVGAKSKVNSSSQVEKEDKLKNRKSKS